MIPFIRGFQEFPPLPTPSPACRKPLDSEALRRWQRPFWRREKSGKSHPKKTGGGRLKRKPWFQVVVVVVVAVFGSREKEAAAGVTNLRRICPCCWQIVLQHVSLFRSQGFAQLPGAVPSQELCQCFRSHDRSDGGCCRGLPDSVPRWPSRLVAAPGRVARTRRPLVVSMRTRLPSKHKRWGLSLAEGVEIHLPNPSPSGRVFSSPSFTRSSMLHRVFFSSLEVEVFQYFFNYRGWRPWPLDDSLSLSGLPPMFRTWSKQNCVGFPYP